MVECCSNLQGTQWNNRLDESKYLQYFESVKAEIQSAVPNSQVVMNQVPKPWHEKDIYCQLIPNDDDNNPFYDCLPRHWAFEVSTVINNADILLYSKLMSRMWPDASLLAKRVSACMSDSKSMDANSLREKYYTTGRQFRAPMSKGGNRGTASSFHKP